MPDVASGCFECEECRKEFVSIQYRSSIYVICPIKSCNVKIKQKSSLKQTRVKEVLVVGLQKPSAEKHGRECPSIIITFSLSSYVIFLHSKGSSLTERGIMLWFQTVRSTRLYLIEPWKQMFLFSALCDAFVSFYAFSFRSEKYSGFNTSVLNVLKSFCTLFHI